MIYCSPCLLIVRADVKEVGQQRNIHGILAQAEAWKLHASTQDRGKKATTRGRAAAAEKQPRGEEAGDKMDRMGWKSKKVLPLLLSWHSSIGKSPLYLLRQRQLHHKSC